MKLIDLTGQKFNRLTVLSRTSSDKSGNTMWKCICDCGNETCVRADQLKSGRVKSCGCYNNEVRSRTHTVHGHRRERIYGIWAGIKKRCNNTNATNYALYGGRGIAVCKEWESDFVPFYEWAISHGYSDSLSIDRIDYNGNYCPENCRWASAKEQSLNRRSNMVVEMGGQKKPLSVWCEDLGVNYAKAYSNIKSGKSPEKAFY